MGDTWMIINGDKKEHCKLCFKTNVKLYGYYGTCNDKGSFHGICEECIDNIGELMW